MFKPKPQLNSAQLSSTETKSNQIKRFKITTSLIQVDYFSIEPKHQNFLLFSSTSSATKQKVIVSRKKKAKITYQTKLKNAIKRIDNHAPEEYASVAEDPKLTKSSEQTELESVSPTASSIFRELAGILTGGGGGTIGKTKLSKSKDATPPLSETSCRRADSDSDRPYFLRNSSTASTSETAMV